MKELWLMLFVAVVGIIVISCMSEEQKTLKKARLAKAAAEEKKKLALAKVEAVKAETALDRAKNNDTTIYTDEELKAIMSNRKLKSDADTRFWLYCLMGVGAFLVFIGAILWGYAGKEKGKSLAKVGGAVILITGTASYYLPAARIILAIGALLGIAAFIYIQYKKFREKEEKEKYTRLFGQVVQTNQEAKLALAEHDNEAEEIFKGVLSDGNDDIKDEIRIVKDK